jgi:hypothetical protein
MIEPLGIHCCKAQNDDEFKIAAPTPVDAFKGVRQNGKN